MFSPAFFAALCEEFFLVFLRPVLSFRIWKVHRHTVILQ